MITLKEIIGLTEFSSLSPEMQDNLNTLLERVNKLRNLYGKPMRVTSGLRTMESHLAIYAKKGITDKSKIPLASKHLYGAALDVSDPKQELQKFILGLSEQELEELGLFFESFEYSKNWVHAQVIPPKSGKRFFKP